MAALILVSVLTGCGGGTSSGSASSAGGSGSSSAGTSASANASTSSAASSGASAEGWEPDGPITFIAPAAVGSGYDTSARSFSRLFNDTGLVSQSIQVVNNVGDAGQVGFTSFAHDYKSTDNALVAASAASITLSLANGWKVSPDDFTPIAKLVTDAFAIVCAADNTGLDTLDKITARLQEDPHSIRIGAAAPPDPDYIGLVMYLQQIGVSIDDIEYVNYEGAGEQLPALLDGQIDLAVASLSEFSSAVGDGQVKAIAVGTEERMGGSYADTPTFKEQGIDLVYGNWRGFWGPKDMPEEMVAYWRNVARAAIETDEWKELCENMQWVTEANIDDCEEWTKEFTDDILAAMQEGGIL